MVRKVMVQRLQPLSIEYKKKFPLMRKITYNYEGVFYLDEGVYGEEEFMKMLWEKFGPGSYQILGWKKFPIMLRDATTRKKLARDKVFPLFKLALVVIEDNGRGRFITNRMKKMFRSFDRPFEKTYDKPFDRPFEKGY